MPSYVIEFDSNHGPERRLFTLDDDRTLDVQLFQVLEELRQSGRVLQGAPGDELAASWNGAELPMQAPMGALGVDTSRPLVLRMRPRPVLVAARPVARYNLRHMVLPPVEGALGALVAWGIAGFLVDLGAPLSTIDRMDLAVAMLLAGLVGLALSLGSVLRGLVRPPAAALSTVSAVAAGAVVLGAVAMVGDVPSIRAFLLARIVAYLIVTILVALVVTAPLRELGGQRFAEAVGVALVGGLFGALLASLPGMSDLWQAIAFIVSGALIGAAAISIPIWRTVTLTGRGAGVSVSTSYAQVASR